MELKLKVGQYLTTKRMENCFSKIFFNQFFNNVKSLSRQYFNSEWNDLLTVRVVCLVEDKLIKLVKLNLMTVEERPKNLSSDFQSLDIYPQGNIPNHSYTYSLIVSTNKWSNNWYKRPRLLLSPWLIKQSLIIFQQINTVLIDL